MELLFKKFLLTTVGAVLLSSNLLAQIEVLRSGVSTSLNAVCFVDTQYGWVVGDSATIIATTDGGQTWRKQYSPVDSVTFKDVVFVDRENGYIAGHFGTIIYTRDGGTTWNKGESGTFYDIYSLSFVTADTGWAAGSNIPTADRNGVILHTVDGGETWVKQLQTTRSFLPSTLFQSVSFSDSKTGWALGGPYFDNFSSTDIFFTSDGGSNWEKVGTISTPMWDLSIGRGDTLWSGGHVAAISIDGGRNWQYKVGGNVQFGNPRAVIALNGTKGWVLAKTLYFTLNSMDSLIDLIPNVNYPLREMDNFGEKHLWAVGRSGTIIKYVSNTVGVNLNETIQHSVRDYELFQNFPNPITHSTEIKFSINSSKIIKLMIFSITGKKIIQLESDQLNSGSYSYYWNTKDYWGRFVPSGVYIFILQVGNSTVGRKALLLR